MIMTLRTFQMFWQDFMVCVEADVTNNFVFKKPKCDDKTYTNL